jgi:hypothetical protein
VTDWPCDADRDDPLAALRIPVTSAWPDSPYLAAFDGQSAARPDEAEAQMIASYIGYQRQLRSSDRRQSRMLERPLDTETNWSTPVLHKRGPGRWAFRRHSWTTGPFFWPVLGSPEVLYMPLLSILDHMEADPEDGICESWCSWKSAHPEIFAKDSPGWPDDEGPE